MEGARNLRVKLLGQASSFAARVVLNFHFVCVSKGDFFAGSHRKDKKSVSTSPVLCSEDCV